MAKVKPTAPYVGFVGNVSVYTMKGCDHVILRRKGGPTKKQIENGERFETTLKNNKEFGGRAIAAAHIKRILHPLMFLADYNITGPLNALLQPIQKMDTDSEWGKMMVALGIAFGTMQGQEIQPVKYIGGAKVIRME